MEFMKVLIIFAIVAIFLVLIFYFRKNKKVRKKVKKIIDEFSCCS
jgi:preprotein translocase subunit YajC